MKKLKYLVLMLVLLLVPVIAFADEEEDTTKEEDNRAIVYFFHGDGCPHCAEAEEWLESIEEEYGSKFKVVAYEVWNDQENAALMQSVSDLRGDNATGVPYLVVGDKSWIGFDEATMASEIKAQIDAVYETPVDERYDALSLVDATGNSKTKEADKKESGNDVVALIIILIVVGGACFGIYKARQSTN